MDSPPPPCESGHGPNAGHPMQDELNLNLLILYIVKIKCQHLTLTPCSICEVLRQLHMVNQHHFRTTSTCMIQLMLLLLVTFHGRASLSTSMEINQKAKFHLGWMQAMMFGFVTPTNLFTTLFQIQTLKMDLTILHIRSMMLMDLITIII